MAIRIIKFSSSKCVRSIADDLDILVAFDQETIDVNYKELTEKGIILADAKFDPVKPEDSKAPLFAVPFTEVAAELGTSLMKNMVAIGATASLLNLEDAVFQNVVDDIFGKRAKKSQKYGSHYVVVKL